MLGRGDDQIRCSFCNKTQAQVRKLIAGPNNTYICDECVDVCSEIIEEELGYEENGGHWSPFSDINLIKPEEIKAFLDEYVILSRIFSTSSPTYPASVNAVASAMAKGTFKILARDCAKSVLPQPVGPSISILLFPSSTPRSRPAIILL